MTPSGRWTCSTARPGRPGPPVARSALGRAATAGRGGPGRRAPAEGHPGRRADRRARRRNAAGVIDLLLEMQREIGATLVMVTHDRDAAGRLDRQIELRDGRVT